MNILMILTSHSTMDNTTSLTGLWLGEFTDAYYVFVDQGYQVTLASPAGGKPPVDPLSTLTENITPSNRRFLRDAAAQEQFDHTVKLEQVRAGEFDGMFIPGGHGPVWDLAHNETSGALIVEFLEHHKPVAAVCHGPAALIAAERERPGLLKGKKLTGFTNAEETIAMRSGNVPYLLETRLKELGGDFRSATIPYTPHVEKDGLLITGQNPLSSGPAAQALVKALEKSAVA